jgi:hypothetical protein
MGKNINSHKIKHKRKHNKTKKHKFIKGGMKKGAIIRDALISRDKKYRYQLSRIWDEDKPKVLFIMLNPSTADETVDDKTIRRVMGFAESWGYGGVFVGNLYAFRSTDPDALRHTDDPVGPDNIQHVQNLIGLTERVIYAWGNKKKEPEWLRDLVDTPYCIDISTKGIPKHPLYLKGELQPKLYLRDV